MSDSLWQFHEKAIVDDHKRQSLNGNADCLFYIPGVDCPHCGRSFGSTSKFAFNCPESILEEVRNVDRKTPCCNLEQWQEYVNRWKKAFPSEWKNLAIEPGTGFQPYQWAIRKIRETDLFWPGSTPIISERLQRVLLKNKVTGASLHQVVDKKANPLCYYNLLLLNDPRTDFWKKESLLVDHCEHCGYEQYRQVKGQQKGYNQLVRKGEIPRKYIPEYEMFTSHIFNGFIVTPRVYDLIKNLDFANCEVRELTVID